MSKPESTGAKSLEEILASIRKSLAEESAERPPEPRLPPQKAAQPQPKPVAPANAAAKLASAPAKGASAPAKGAMPLAAKLAGAVNGSASGPSLDADLSELLAAEPKKLAPSAPGDASKPADSSTGTDDGKDPLWFLTRLSAAAAGSAAQGPAARARDAAKASGSGTPPAAEEVKLSRPETLRPSLPPLFDAVREPPPAAAKSEKPAGIASMTARTQPRVAPPQADAAGTAKETVKEKDKAEPEAPGATAASAEMASPASTPPAREAEPAATKETAQPATVSRDWGPVAPASSALPFEAKAPTTQPAELKPGGAPESLSALADTAAAASSGPMGGLQSRALEQMVAELLEPVIRQWLQSNLPRLIEKAVREEVARVVATEREAAKG